MEDDNNALDANVVDDDGDEVHTIGYSLCDLYVDPRTWLAQCKLRMPSGSRVYNNEEWSRPTVVMDIEYPDNLHSLQLMMKSTHKNILHARVMKSEDSVLVAWTEPYSCRLIDCLEDMQLNLGDWTGMVPSVPLQIVVSQWFDGIGHLRDCGNYHGAFSLENTYCHFESGSSIPIVKLTNFKLKDGKSLIKYQLEDVSAIARGLDGICSIAEKLNNEGPPRALDCTLVVDLAKKLREISAENLVSIMKDIKKHMFFWNEIDREKFYVCDFPFASRSKDFRDALEASNICNVPWDTDGYAGLLDDMNNYRVRNKKPAYDRNKKADFCSFCSGLYTHQSQLDSVKFRGILVDPELHDRHPKACFEIVSLMPDREKKYMLSKKEVES